MKKILLKYSLLNYQKNDSAKYKNCIDRNQIASLNVKAYHVNIACMLIITPSDIFQME